MEHQLIIIGGGLAGLTAGLQGARQGLGTLVIERLTPGGQVANIERIETFPGFAEGISGAELGPTVQVQAEQAGARFKMDEVMGLEPVDGGFVVRCAGGEYRARAVIIAAGSSRRSLGIAGEAEFRGRGVSECASCDGPFYIGKRVVVVGGGDAAVEEACVLADMGVAEVRLVHRDDGFRAQQALRDKLQSRANIRTELRTELVGIRGTDGVSEVVLRHAGAERVEPADGVFPFIGLEPNTGWLGGVVDLDGDGRIRVDALLRTSRPGIFAAGDIRQHSVAQLAASAGDGATAAIAAWRYLSGRG